MTNKTIHLQSIESKSLSRTAGFTVIELLIAMAIFSSLLTLSVIGFIQINQIYQQGLATQRTQEEARRVLEGIVRDGRESSSIQVAGPGLPVGILCTGNHIYFVDDGSLYKRNRDSDPCLPGSIAGSERLTPTDLEVSRFQLSPWEGPDGSGGYRSVQVTIRIATAGTDDLMDGDGQCDPRVTGAEFCSASELSSMFTTRGAFSTGGDEE